VSFLKLDIVCLSRGYFFVYFSLFAFLFVVTSFSVYNTALDLPREARLRNDSYVLRGMLHTTCSLTQKSSVVDIQVFAVAECFVRIYF